MAHSATAAPIIIPGARKHQIQWGIALLAADHYCENRDCRKQLPAGTPVFRGEKHLTTTCACNENCKPNAETHSGYGRIRGTPTPKFR